MKLSFGDKRLTKYRIMWDNREFMRRLNKVYLIQYMTCTCYHGSIRNKLV